LDDFRAHAFTSIERNRYQVEEIMRKVFIAAALGAVGVSGVAWADIGIDVRQANQQRQIDAGKRSGKLSLRERQILNAEQRRIADYEAQLRAKGNNLSEADERALNAMLDRSQAHINALKRNRERGRSGIHF